MTEEKKTPTKKAIPTVAEAKSRDEALKGKVPQIGSSVIYTNQNGVHQAAVVTHVYPLADTGKPHLVDLAILTRSGLHNRPKVEKSSLLHGAPSFYHFPLEA